MGGGSAGPKGNPRNCLAEPSHFWLSPKALTSPRPLGEVGKGEGVRFRGPALPGSNPGFVPSGCVLWGKLLHLSLLPVPPL